MSTREHEVNTRDYEKETAAHAAAELVQSGNIVGLGSGSTATYAIESLAKRVREGLRIVGIPTSEKTRQLAQELGIPLTTLEEQPEIDITLDGADEIDRDLNLIKGGGGALLREKIIASASRRLIIVADSAKQVLRLGRFPLPVEVIAFAQTLIAKRIAALGAQVSLRRNASGNPYVTDERHHILDCTFGEIMDAPALAETLRAMPGVVEHGLFIGMAEMALVGAGGNVLRINRR